MTKRARISNGLIALINIITLILSLCVIGYSIYNLAAAGSTSSPCHRVLGMPLLVLGGALFVVSLMGLMGSCMGMTCMLWMYLFVLFVLILGVTAFMIFSFVVTNKGAGKALSNRGIGEHRLGDYSRWLQKYVINQKNWEQIKDCLGSSRTCQMIEEGKGEHFYKERLSSFQSGCCKPPNFCGLQFHNATFWTMPPAGPAAPHPDCTTWSNIQTKLCFDCDSCKTAVLENLKIEWRSLLYINVAVLIFIIIIYSIGCCAFRNRDSKDGYSKYRSHA